MSEQDRRPEAIAADIMQLTGTPEAPAHLSSRQLRAAAYLLVARYDIRIDAERLVRWLHVVREVRQMSLLTPAGREDDYDPADLVAVAIGETLVDQYCIAAYDGPVRGAYAEAKVRAREEGVPLVLDS